MSHPILVLVLLALVAFHLSYGYEDTNDSAPHDHDLLVGAFNIRVFGKSKSKKTEVMDVICKIVPRYDILLVQEIRDSSQTAFASMVERVNEEAGKELYEFVTGRRVGRSSSKEQYGFIYRVDKVEIERMYERYDEYDVFEREPIVVRFARVTEGGKQRSFTFIPLHAKPDDALEEMNNLVEVYDESERYFGPDAVIAGDLNADCSYVCKSCWDKCTLKNDDRFLWVIPDDADTTVTKTDCAYDRIILAGSEMQKNTCCARIYRFDQEHNCGEELAEDISDHYPVEFIIH